MTTVTTVPVGATGINLEGVDVNGAVRESVVQADPEVADAFSRVVSTEPAAGAYGGVVRVAGTPSVSVAALPGLNVVSSIPFYVAQSSSPWTVNGQVGVTSNVTIQGTSSVNVISSVPHALVGTSQVFGTVSSQIISSIPFFVAQSSAPWTINGGVTVSTAIPGTTMVNVVSTVAQAVNVTVVANNITSSIPFFVAQSSAPWVMAPTASSAGGGNVTSIVCGATLNTTVIKAGAGQIYSVSVSNFGSSNAWVKLGNASTAAPVSTVPTKFLIGVHSSTTIYHAFPMGTEFSTGIVMYTIRTPFAAGSGTTGILSSSMTVSVCYE